MKHTPGPWEQYAPAIKNKEGVEEVNEHYRYIKGGRGYHDFTNEEDRGKDGFLVAGGISPEDACILGVALEMMEALELTLQAHGACDGRGCFCEVVRTAIKKAHGEL